MSNPKTGVCKRVLRGKLNSVIGPGKKRSFASGVMESRTEKCNAARSFLAAGPYAIARSNGLAAGLDGVPVSGLGSPNSIQRAQPDICPLPGSRNDNSITRAFFRLYSNDSNSPLLFSLV
jgi:hypothetical protein